MTSEQQAVARRLRDEGHTVRACAQAVGAAQTTVGRLLREARGVRAVPPVATVAQLGAASARVLTLRSIHARLVEALEAAVEGREVAVVATELRRTSLELERAEQLAASDAAARHEAEQAGRADELEAAIDRLVVRTRGVQRAGTG